MIGKRFPKSHWHVAYEVSSVGGGMMTAGARWADCIALGREKSDGEILIHGLEIKIIRGDVINEIRKPEKSAPFLKLCHYWWMLCPPSLIEIAQELPERWGIATHGPDDRFTVIRPAPFNPDAQVTPLFAYSLLSARVRDRHDDVRRNEVQQMVGMVGKNDDLFYRAKEINEAIQNENSRLMERLWTC